MWHILKFIWHSYKPLSWFCSQPVPFFGPLTLHEQEIMLDIPIMCRNDEGCTNKSTSFRTLTIWYFVWSFNKMTFAWVFIKLPSVILIALVHFLLLALFFLIIYPSLSAPLLTVHCRYAIKVETTGGHVKMERNRIALLENIWKSGLMCTVTRTNYIKSCCAHFMWIQINL